MKLGIIGLGARMTHLLNNAMRPHAADLQVVGLVEPDRRRAEEALTDREKRRGGVFLYTLDELVEKTRPDAPGHRHPLPFACRLCHAGGGVRPARFFGKNP